MKIIIIIIIIKAFNHTVVSLQNEDKTNNSTIIHIYCFPSQVGLILQFHLPGSNSLSCKPVNTDDVYTIKSFKTDKYLKAEWKNNTTKLSFKGNSNDCGICKFSNQIYYIVSSKENRVLSLERVEKLWATNTRPT